MTGKGREKMTHILRRGETPEQLSARYGVPVCMLMKANRGRQMAPGRALIIPERGSCGGRSYRVKKGDTLYSIAQKNNTTMYDLSKENPGVFSGGLADGMVIRLPEASRIYTCGVLDTVQSVCERFGIAEEALRSCNPLEKNLYQGLQLKIPERSDL